MNFQKGLCLLLLFIVSGSVPLFGMQSKTKTEQPIKIEKLYDDQLADEFFKFLHGGDIKSLKAINSETIEKLFGSSDETSFLYVVVQKSTQNLDKKVLFFSVCCAFNRFLLSTSTQFRAIFLRLAKHGIELSQSQDPLSTFFTALHNDTMFKGFFEETAFKQYFAQWNNSLIKERATFSIPKQNTSQHTSNNKDTPRSNESIDVEGVFEGDHKELINAGGSINVILKKGALVLSCEAGSLVKIEKVDPQTDIIINDQEFLNRFKDVMTKQSMASQETSVSQTSDEIPEVLFSENNTQVTENIEKVGLKKTMSDNLSWFAPLSILGAAAGIYCLMDTPLVSILATVGVFYITDKCHSGIKKFYDEVTRSEKSNTKQETKNSGGIL